MPSHKCKKRQFLEICNYSGGKLSVEGCFPPFRKVCVIEEREWPHRRREISFGVAHCAEALPNEHLKCELFKPYETTSHWVFNNNKKKTMKAITDRLVDVAMNLEWCLNKTLDTCLTKRMSTRQYDRCRCKNAQTNWTVQSWRVYHNTIGVLNLCRYNLKLQRPSNTFILNKNLEGNNTAPTDWRGRDRGGCNSTLACDLIDSSAHMRNSFVKFMFITSETTCSLEMFR